MSRASYGFDDGMRTLNVDCDPRVRRDVDALELKQESQHSHLALDRGGAFQTASPP